MAYIKDTLLIEEIKSLKVSLGGKNIFPDEVKESILRIINEQPTADVIEVIRCKDCKHRGDFVCPMYYEEDIEWDDDGYTECETIIHDMTTDDGFCSSGERRETSTD